MKRFMQGHILTIYSPSNTNRDDFGNPKSSVFGDVTRKRFSSQALKRAYRTSEVFGEALQLDSKRTNRLGEHLRDMYLGRDGYDNQDVCEAAIVIQNIINQRDSSCVVTNRSRSLSNLDEMLSDFRAAYEENADAAIRNSEFFKTKEISMLHPFEMAAAEDAMRMVLAEGLPTDADFDENKDAVLRFFSEGIFQRILEGGNPERVADVALFARMFTTKPGDNIDAAINISHSLSTHAVEKETDFFTAVDDLNKGSGSAHMGEKHFSAGTMYLYWLIDLYLLRSNLEKLSGQTPTVEQLQRIVRLFVQATITVSPGGNQTTMASRPYADYLRIETTDNQPSSHHRAFERPIVGDNQLAKSIHALEKSVDDVNIAYGDIYQVDHCTMNVPAREGTWSDIVDFINEQID